MRASGSPTSWPERTDGLKSQVAEWVGAPVERRGRHATGVGAIPTHDGLTCIVVALPPARLRVELVGGRETAYRSLLAEAAPALAERVAGSAPAGPLRAFPGTPGFLRRAYGPGWALVGDAGFFRDPITAHGMTDALRHAELLARAVLSGTPDALAGYQAARNELAVEMLEISDEVASFEWDLPRVEQLHLDLSRNMAREVEAIRGLDGEVDARRPKEAPIAGAHHLVEAARAVT